MTILHETARRLRLGVPPDAHAATLRAGLARLPGVASVRVNAQAQCVVVQHDGRSETRAAVLNLMRAGVEARPQPERVREKLLVQRAGQLMYELSLHYPSISGLKAQWAWSLPVVTTLDGLPWVGTHRNYPFHFFGIALGWHGDSISWFTARAAARHFTGETRAGDDAFTFLRALQV